MLRFRLGRLRVGVSIWFAAFFAVVFFMSDNALLLYGLLAMLCHELGHFAAMALAGLPVRGFYLLMGQLVIVPARRLVYTPAELPILLGGVAANLLGAALFGLWGNARGCAVNLAIAAYNALPAAGLDGGGALLALLSGICAPRRAYAIYLAASFGVSFLILAAGFALLLRGGASAAALMLGVYLTAQSVKNMRYTNGR
jgi:hypothetical protein